MLPALEYQGRIVAPTSPGALLALIGSRNRGRQLAPEKEVPPPAGDGGSTATDDGVGPVLPVDAAAAAWQGLTQDPEPEPITELIKKPRRRLHGKPK
jgi:hypothetical protein